MSDKPDPGVGWRLLEIGEVIEPSDQFFSCGGEWRTVVSNPHLRGRRDEA